MESASFPPHKDAPLLHTLPSAVRTLGLCAVLGIQLACRADLSAEMELPNSMAAARGGEVPLLGIDSATALLVLTAECAKCRIGVASYPDVQNVVVDEGLAFRSLIASGPPAARQFALLLPDVDHVLLDSDSGVLNSLGVATVPALVLVDRTRRRTQVVELSVPNPDTAEIRRHINTFR